MSSNSTNLPCSQQGSLLGWGRPCLLGRQCSFGMLLPENTCQLGTELGPCYWNKIVSVRYLPKSHRTSPTTTKQGIGIRYNVWKPCAVKFLLLLMMTTTTTTMMMNDVYVRRDGATHSSITMDTVLFQTKASYVLPFYFYGELPTGSYSGKLKEPQ